MAKIFQSKGARNAAYIRKSEAKQQDNQARRAAARALNTQPPRGSR